jgi:hypothetical protein
MQWEHQIRSSGMLDGMAVTFSKEVLRTVQNAISIHKAVPPADATNHTYLSLYTEGDHPCLQTSLDMVSSGSGNHGMAGMPTMVNEGNLEDGLLDRRFWLGTSIRA